VRGSLTITLYPWSDGGSAGQLATQCEGSAHHAARMPSCYWKQGEVFDVRRSKKNTETHGVAIHTHCFKDKAQAWSVHGNVMPEAHLAKTP
jgi:hypothetical protein